jgi:polysaccharide biosynthesis transport protein
LTKSYSLELPPQITSLSGDNTSELPFDFKSLIGSIYRRMWLILAGFLTTFLLVSYITFTQVPLYKASSTVQLGTKERNVIDLDSVLTGLAGSTAEVDTEVLVMSSKSLLTRVAMKQKLADNPEFNTMLVPAKGGIGSAIRAMFGGKPEPAGAKFAGMTIEARDAAIMEDIVKNLKDAVDIKRIGTTYLIRAEVTSTSPVTATQLADAIADEYIIQQLETKLEATRIATSYLQNSVESLRIEVQDKESRVEQFRASAGLDAAMGTTLTEQNIAYLTSQKSSLEVDLQRTKSRFDQMRSRISTGSGIDSLAEVLDSQTMTRLKEQRAMVLRTVADLETRRGPSHPELISARNEAADIERQIRSEATDIAGNLESEVKIKQGQINSIQRDINSSSSTLRGNSMSMVRLRELERDAETSRLLLEQFLSRSKETRQQDELVRPDANVLATASVPVEPSSPRVIMNLLIGALLGMLLGGALACLAEMFDSKISSTEDVERKLNVASIGSVPLVRSAGLVNFGSVKTADYLVENPLSAYAESIRYLRAAIAFSDLDSETKTVAICSSLPDEGKTSLTLSLGRMSAMSGSRTLVIDGDFRRRQLTETAGLKPEIGFIEHLFGAGQLSDAITKDRKSMLDILPLSASGHTPHDVFGTRAFDDLLARLRSMYDLILIDTGPLLLMAEARVIAGKADKAILVVRWRSSTSSAVRQSLNLLKSFRADLLGVTLNMVDLNRRRHHRDPGASYKAYRKYYQMDQKKTLFGWNSPSPVRSAPSKPQGDPQKPVATRNDRQDEKADRMPAK